MCSLYRNALAVAGTVNMTAEEAARVGMSASATQAQAGTEDAASGFSRFEHQPADGRFRCCLFDLPQVLPLLLAVLDVSTTMPEELFGNVTRNAKKCMSQHLVSRSS